MLQRGGWKGEPGRKPLLAAGLSGCRGNLEAETGLSSGQTVDCHAFVQHGRQRDLWPRDGAGGGYDEVCV